MGGRCLEHIEAKGRVAVALDNGEKVLLKPLNLTKPPMDGGDAAAAAGDGAAAEE